MRFFHFFHIVLPIAYMYPQCFIFFGFSILTAILILNCWSSEPLATVALYHSGALEDEGVGLMTTFPNPLSSRESIPGLSVYSLTFTTGVGLVVENSPGVSQ